MPKKTYTCWSCHRRGFTSDELISHRCKECRAERLETVEENPELSNTPWSVDGQQVWVRHDGLGEDGGVFFRERKRSISKEEAAKRLEKLKRLPTWKNGSRS